MLKVISTLAIITVILVAVLHIGFLVLEMFYWDHELGRRIFSMTPEVSKNSALLAANQGLYNGFLAAGLLWSLATRKRDVTLFFSRLRNRCRDIRGHHCQAEYFLYSSTARTCCCSFCLALAAKAIKATRSLRYSAEV